MAQTLAAESLNSTLSEDKFQRYYEEAGPDYASWSPNFNMHFGYFRAGMNPFDREAMLEQMNLEVLRRLQISTMRRPRVLDMGCGLGATLRAIRREHPSADLHGVTLVPWQLEQGRCLNRSSSQAEKIRVGLTDFEHTGFPSGGHDAIYAIESSCYGTGAGKSKFLREAYRLLRPGGRLVVADGFLDGRKLRGLQKAIFRTLSDCWAIESMGDMIPFTQELKSTGFREIVVERIQARVAPSVLHVPFVTLKFLITEVLMGPRKMTRARWNNILAPVLLPLVSFPIGPFAYYLVSATRG
ncbi:MAG: class I SAM-dependent methyltransferase [Acidobacteria bacterium]|nr:class I SAM-dependent methyltransferase [Acidobacteriota bacterium]